MPSDLRFSRSDSDVAAPRASVAPSPAALARWCAGRGWPVHPLAAGRKTPAGNCADCQQCGHSWENCACLEAGRWCHGFHAATLDPDRIEQWWSASPAHGVGVACGPAGLVVIDVDAHASAPPDRDRLLPGIPIGPGVDVSELVSGFHTLAVLAALRGVPVPTSDAGTLRVRTPSGGMHVWYRVPDGRRWLCSTGSGKGKGRALAWQVDVRAHGGYIIAPGTVTHDGTYTPVGDTREPAPLPGWLGQELERTGHLESSRTATSPAALPPQRARQAVAAAGGGRTSAERALTPLLAEVTACAVALEGTGFSEKLNRAAYTAGGLTAAGHIPEAAAEHLLIETARAARPGQEHRAAQIIRSGMTAGMRNPLYLEGRR